MTDDTPRNSRERVARNGFKRREPKLVALAHPDEWRSIRYAQERVQHAIGELAATLDEADVLRDSLPPQASKPTPEQP